MTMHYKITEDAVFEAMRIMPDCCLKYIPTGLNTSQRDTAAILQKQQHGWWEYMRRIECQDRRWLCQKDVILQFRGQKNELLYLTERKLWILFCEENCVL